MALLPSVVALGLVALVALHLARVRASPPELAEERRAAATALGIALGVQCLHFTEETVTGFETRFPAMFGLPPIPMSLFVGFNLAWIVVWMASVPALRVCSPAGFFAAWFLAIAAMLNGIAHPLLAVVAAGYFPGLVSSPLIAAAGVRLWLRLRAATPIERRSAT